MDGDFAVVVLGLEDMRGEVVNVGGEADGAVPGGVGSRKGHRNEFGPKPGAFPGPETGAPGAPTGATGTPGAFAGVVGNPGPSTGAAGDPGA